MSVGSSGLFGIITARNPDGKSSPSFRAEAVNRGFWKATKLFAQNREGRKGGGASRQKKTIPTLWKNIILHQAQEQVKYTWYTHSRTHSLPSLPDGPRTYHHLTGQTERLARLPVQKESVCACPCLASPVPCVLVCASFKLPPRPRPVWPFPCERPAFSRSQQTDLTPLTRRTSSDVQDVKLSS